MDKSLIEKFFDVSLMVDKVEKDRMAEDDQPNDPNLFTIVKMQEELGEIAESYLIMTGYKVKKGETYTSALINIREEVVDLMMLTFIMSKSLGLTKEEILRISAEKLQK